MTLPLISAAVRRRLSPQQTQPPMSTDVIRHSGKPSGLRSLALILAVGFFAFLPASALAQQQSQNEQSQNEQSGAAEQAQTRPQGQARTEQLNKQQSVESSSIVDTANPQADRTRGRNQDDRDQIPQSINGDAIAAHLSKVYAKTGRAKKIQQNGTALYPYGESEPVLSAAPLRASIIELQRGEQIINIIAGDPSMWMIQQGAQGPPGRQVPLLIIKPRDWNLTSNLIISTDRRLYRIMLDAPKRPASADPINPSQAYIERMRFYYPHDFVRRMKTQELRRERLATMTPSEAERARAVQSAHSPYGEGYSGGPGYPQGRGGAGYPPGAYQQGGYAPNGYGGRGNGSNGRVPSRRTPINSRGVSLTDLNFNYTWESSDDFGWEPIEVFDDGQHTYIKVPGSASAERPMLFDVSRAGEPEMVNYAIRNNTYITDRVLKKAILTIGVDKRKGPLSFMGVGPKVRDKAELEIYNRTPMTQKTWGSNEHRK